MNFVVVLLRAPPCSLFPLALLADMDQLRPVVPQLLDGELLGLIFRVSCFRMRFEFLSIFSWLWSVGNDYNDALDDAHV